MKKRVVLWLLLTFVWFTLPLLPQTKPVSDNTPSEYHIQRKIFQPELCLKGVIVPAEIDSISISLKEFKGSLTVKEIVPSGTSVKEGDKILSIDPEPIARLIQEAIRKSERLQFNIGQIKSKMDLDLKARSQELEKAKIRFINAQDKLKNYKEIEWPLQKDRDDLAIKRNESYLANQITELQQLEEMYNSSEVAGKTKEIVLERAKREAEIAKISLEITRRDVEYRRQVENPKRVDDLTNEEKWAREELALLESRISVNLAETKQALDELGFEMREHIKYLERLKTDNELLDVRATKGGIVIHGNLFQRLLSGKSPAVKPYEEIKLGDNIQNKEIVLTLYSPDKFVVVTPIPETFRYIVKDNTPAKVHIKALPDKIFEATVSKIPDVADDTENNTRAFSTRLTLEDNDTRLKAGFTCTVEFRFDQINDAMVIPANLLTERRGKYFVNLKRDGQTIEKEVMVGIVTDEAAWITSGLKIGDVIVTKK